MRLAKIRVSNGEDHVAVVSENDEVQLLDLSQVESANTLTDILHAPDPTGLAKFLVHQSAPVMTAGEVQFLAPIDQQEVWAAGVTYKRSQVARMEESEAAASHYDKVYTADRPELFLKATPSRVSGPDEPVRVRYDSQWSVPEPELGLVVTPDGSLCGFTVGNDMSARDIEGENPLYLPQAKTYRQCCGLGPTVLLTRDAPERSGFGIELKIERRGEVVFNDTTSAGEMVREFTELIGWLMRENDFPNGAVLLTGTGLVPPDDFTLKNGDMVSITIDGIGTLTNPVVQANP